MIQRIQTLWLVIVALTAFATYTLDLYVGKVSETNRVPFPFAQDLLLVLTIIALGILAIICLSLFKNRKLQFKLSVFGVIFSVAFLFLEYLRVESFKKDHNFISGAYQPGAILPLIMAVFFFLAARSIYRDERLVKSMDRLR
jgi:chromate transport protein ChrA